MATRRYSTRLRFEVGQSVPVAGETFLGETMLMGQKVAVTVHRNKRQFERPSEPGVTLMDAYITRRDISV